MSAQSSATVGKAENTPTKEQQKPTAALEEDDEFEDFPAEGTAATLPSHILVIPWSL
jgi:hypothetical protein